MTDRWVTSRELDAMRRFASDDCTFAYRFDDGNDSAEHNFMFCIRGFSSVNSMRAFCVTSKAKSYMGRKRRTWYPVERAQ